MDKAGFSEGIQLLQQPVMPLVGMVQFLFMTGPFDTVADVVGELPAPIETEVALYEKPQELLAAYLDILSQYENIKNGDYEEMAVVDEENRPVDPLMANTAVIQQRILTRELEKINSVLCSPCGCTLCCVGPDKDMAQEFFEIPLAVGELDLFSLERFENEQSRSRHAYDDDELVCDGLPFYRRSAPALIHWINGWSLIMPRDTRCPNLRETGQCNVYNSRPEVCRRPQVFPYMVEPYETTPGKKKSYRIRQSLLAITDCPYVNELKDEIGKYAAASELKLVFNQNKA